MGKSTFFKKTSLLITSNILSGILVFIFILVLSREIGARGMGLYQLVMPLYSMLLYITGGGIAVAISTLAAQEKANGKLRELYRTVYLVFIVELVWSLLITALIVLSANFISKNLLSDSRTYYSIIAFCPALIMISLSSIIKGVYYGIQRVIEPAIIDIVEKAVKILLMYPMVTYIKGMSLEYAAAAALLALSIGEMISLIFLIITFRRYMGRNVSKRVLDNDYQLCFNLFRMAIPISLEGVITALFGTLTAILIPKRLQSSGLSYEEALSLLGKLQGMTINIAFFPMIINSAYNLLLIPSIAETTNSRLLIHRINSAIKLTIITSTLTTAIIISAPIKIGNFFYGDEIVGKLLFMLAPALPLVYLELLSYSILNGLGKQTKLLFNSILIQTLDIILLYIFIGSPRLNIYGYVLNITISSIVGIFINYRLIIKVASLKINWARSIVIPILCSILTYLIANNYIFKFLKVPEAIIISIIIYSLMYFVANI